MYKAVSHEIILYMSGEKNILYQVPFMSSWDCTNLNCGEMESISSAWGTVLADGQHN